MADYTNAWSAFRQFVSTPTRKTGVITIIHGDNTATLTLPDSSQVRVNLGALQPSIGDNVFYRNQVVEAPAPTLTTVEVETP